MKWYVAFAFTCRVYFIFFSRPLFSPFCIHISIMLSDWSHVNITKWKLNAEHSRKFVTLEKKNTVNHLHSFWFAFIRKTEKQPIQTVILTDLDIETKNGMVNNVSNCNISTDAYIQVRSKNCLHDSSGYYCFFPNIIWSFRLMKSYFHRNEFTTVYRFYEKDSDWDVICWENLSRSTLKPCVQFIYFSQEERKRVG